ncbi:protein translocase subunit SecD [Bremerella cremea]|uniref:Multifunctional fusion protein n=1 Tax=Blastopirellula marina TaxID=124 RepID=A0A2S8FRD8_9BACT|nr:MULTISPECIES: protein translocase subunit SecD [Pirellulaceae]PQO34414.1 hypothetical protein C5Y83_12870 [Blastopirellula marina]RCS46910.1 protein translocase subunit SecD [Bremerella cremea]
MQKSCTIFAVMLVLTLTVTLLTGVDFGLDAGGSSWLGSTAMAQTVPAGDATGPTIEVTPVQAQASESEGYTTFNVLAVIALTIVLPYFLGAWIAKAIRLPDLSQRLGITLASLVCSIAICVLLWPPRFGIDLQGGIILIYEVDEEASLDLLATNAAASGNTSVLEQTNAARLKEGTAQLIQQLQKRINPSGVSEVVIRPYGENQVEVQIPLAESADLDSIKRRITKAGVLDFLILANSQDHDFLMTRAQDESQYGVTYVTDREGNRIGRWVRVEKDRAGAVGNYNPTSTDMTPMINESRHMVRGGGPGQTLEALMKVEPPEYQLSGSHLNGASVTRDEYGSPAISFSFNVDGTNRMGHLSQNNLTEPNIPRQLGIVMDNVLISAPRINAVITDSGIITGDFSQQEASDLAQVLRAGKLPVVLRKEPISEQTISATLGDDTVRKGKIAIGISLIAVLIFMVIYYRVAGVVACFALLFNLLLIMAVLIPIADLTLPGIAGLVLTVGMSVDANVLIFERIREELKGGATLRVALNNGFSKAMSTIVDANITTLITAAVLYRIGTDQVRGFGVTLFIGILMSMFTAIYVSRGIFEILERKRIIKSLSFMPSASSIGYDFIGKQKVAAIVSVVVILVGLIGVGARGKTIFDIDFNGGSSVQIYLNEPMPISEVRSKLTGVLPDLSVSAVTLEGSEDRIYKVDTSLAEYGELGKVLMTDRKGKSAEVDLSGLNSLNQIIKKLDAADVEIAVTPNVDSDGIEFTDATNSSEGEMSVKNVDDKTNTASNLKMNFSTDALRYNTGMIPAGVDVVQDKIEEVFTGPNGESLLVMHNMDFTPPTGEAASSSPEATDKPETSPTTTEAPMEEKPAAPEGDEQSFLAPVSSKLLAMLPWQLAFDAVLLQDEEAPEEPPMEEAKPADEKPAEEAPAEEKPADEPPAEEKPMEEQPAEPMAEPMPMTEPAPMAETSAESPMTEAPATEAQATETPAEETPTSEVPAGSMFNEEAAPEKPRFATETELTFDEGISADTVRSLIDLAADDLAVARPEVALLDKDGNLLPMDSRVSQEKWAIKMSTSPAESAKILEKMSVKLDATPVWPSSSKIGSKVAGDMQTMAVSAILFCLIGIVGYIWFRFQSVAFGLAAVVALVHDVLVTLGFIALSLWMAPALGFLQVTEFKISLPVVAAFLTIIGYSLNDTIVIFDRIREVRGKDPHLTPEMVNLSVNQTLGRTLLTSLTTLIVVMILYFIGGEGIHSFAFSLVIGVIAGTYSTIFIACPVLLWLMNRDQGKAKA